MHSKIYNDKIFIFRKMNIQNEKEILIQEQYAKQDSIRLNCDKKNTRCVKEVNREDDPNIAIYFMERHGFDVEKVNVILSIVGHTDQFILPERLSLSLRKALRILTETVDTLFITG